MLKHTHQIVLLVAALSILGACAEDETPHDHGNVVSLESGLVDARFDRDEAFQQVGLLFDAPESTVWYRAAQTDEALGEWKQIQVTFSEDNHHVGRVILDAPAKVVEFRSAAALQMGHLEFYPQVVGSSVLTRDLPMAEPDVVLNGLAPANLVINRAAWGARSPNKVCGSPHNPYRISIHHTASPDSDGGDPAARMRQMQAYHIDSNGWCDIGYHFVVSQSGEVFQGRSDEARSGAHVGNQNNGNIGISLIGNFEVQTPSQTQLGAAAEILGWVAQTYQIPYTRDAIKGHREWPGQGTSCPGKNLLNGLEELIAMASGGPAPPPPEPGEYDVAFSVNVISGGEDVYQDGTSQSVLDVFPGDEIEAEIRVKNLSESPLRGVLVGYWLDSPFLQALDYRIESDYPAQDGATFELNDANEAPENPEPMAFGADGQLVMYAFAAGETKRVVVRMKALKPSIGLVDHPELRAWIRNIDDVYGVQEAFDAEPTNGNLVGRLLQDSAQLDMLSRDRWGFAGTDSGETEGWFACSDETNVLTVSESAMNLSGLGACAESPAWTVVDAGEFDQMVLRLKSPSTHEKISVYWANQGDDQFASGMAFDPTQDTVFVLPLGTSEAWRGMVDAIRLQGSGAGTTEIDALFFQRGDGTTTDDDEPFVEKEPVDMQEPDGTPVRDRVGDEGDGDSVTTGTGCAQGGGAIPGPLGFLMLLGFALFRRRRYSSWPVLRANRTWSSRWDQRSTTRVTTRMM